jgi:tRNA threonylcarbamoyladenosine biosynthesis protein TsaE
MTVFPFKECTVSSESEMAAAALQFLEFAEKSEAKNALVVGLKGDLGAGKTTFTQAVAKALNISSVVTSPTFVIEKIYEISKSAKSRFQHLIHIDAYRIESSGEMARLGFAEIAADHTNLILIEWPEKLGDLLPPSAPLLRFEHVSEKVRKIK